MDSIANVDSVAAQVLADKCFAVERRCFGPLSITALDPQRRSLLLARDSGGTITLLVINDDLGRVFYFRRLSAIRLPDPAALV